jgi:four helix bundle protein
MNKKIKTFKDLKVWQKGIDLVREIYRITKNFPQEEQYNLSAQMKRASVSIPSNIAEGFRRKHPTDYKRFLNMSLGSCAELETDIEIARQLGYIKETDESILLEIIDHICGMLVNLDKKV